jgi:hypothetical protein
MQLSADSRYRNRAMLESWAQGVAGSVAYYRDPDGRWTVTLRASSEPGPETLVLTSGPVDSIEAGCVVVMTGLLEAGQTMGGFTPPE